MLIYVSKQFTATAAGAALRAVACEKCRREYFYEASRVAAGSGSSPYYLNNQGALRRAEERAQANLRKALAGAADAVPCPHCGWVQASMARQVRRERLRWLPKFAGVGLFLTLVVLLIAFAAASGDKEYQSRYGPILLGTAAASVALAAAAMVWVWRARAAVDPNERLPGGARRHALPAAPPALVPAPWPPRATADGDDESLEEGPDEEAAFRRDHVLLVPAAGAAEALRGAARDRWVTVQLQKIGWPDACELCLGEPQATYADSVPLKLGEGASSPLPVPVCDACRRRLRRRWWKWAAAVAAGVMVGSYFLLQLTDIDKTGRAIILWLGGSILAIISAPVVAGHVSPPHRCQTVDAPRGFYRLWFENPQYTALMAEAWASPQTHTTAAPVDLVEVLLAGARSAAPRATPPRVAAPPHARA